MKEQRSEDPGIGGLKLYLMLVSIFGRDNMPGRDRFLYLLRRKRLMLPAPRARHTTNSNHRYHKYKNLIRGFVPTACNQLWVSDITYIDTEIGCFYLHLISDAYSHKIIGWKLSESLKAIHTLEALQEAIKGTGEEDLTGLIHHSDRGSQYCCNMYVEELERRNISISMTEDYKPTDNAIAERINGIIKQEFIYRIKRFKTSEEAEEKIRRFILFYNEKRPHMSIGMKTPNSVHEQSGPQEKMWKNKIYKKKSTEKPDNFIDLQTQQQVPVKV